MGADDQREVREFFGIYTDDWTWTFGTFSNTHYMLSNDYISNNTSTTESSEASLTHTFLYPFYIKKTYFVEGVVEGEFTLAASGATATATEYRVSLWKTYDGASLPDKELKSTGWKTINDTLWWDDSIGEGVGQEITYHFFIDIWDEQKLTDEQKLYLKIEVNCDQYTHLMHANDSRWEDVWVAIPLRL